MKQSGTHTRIIAMNCLAIIALAVLTITTFTYHASAQSADHGTRKMLLRDEGLSQLSLIDIAKPQSNWYVKVPPGP